MHSVTKATALEADPVLQTLLDSSRLTLPERRVLASLLNGKSVQKAAALGGMAYETVTKSLDKGRLRVAFLNICEEQGLTDTAIVGAIVDGLQAEYGDAKPNHGIRLKAAELGAKLKGHFPASGDGDRITQINIQTNLDMDIGGAGPEWSDELAVEFTPMDSDPLPETSQDDEKGVDNHGEIVNDGNAKSTDGETMA